MDGYYIIYDHLRNVSVIDAYTYEIFLTSQSKMLVNIM